MSDILYTKDIECKYKDKYDGTLDIVTWHCTNPEAPRWMNVFTFTCVEVRKKGECPLGKPFEVDWQ